MSCILICFEGTLVASAYNIMNPVTLQLLRTVNLQHQRIDGVDDGSRLIGRIPTTPEKFRSKMEKAVFPTDPMRKASSVCKKRSLSKR